jgi:predicted Zn-dependent peptidase
VIYKAYPMAARREKNYYIADLISDVLSGGNSARLHQRLVKEQKLFSQIDCYHTGSIEKGLLVIEGKISEGITAEQADAAIEKELDLLKSEKIAETELEKVKTKIESMLAFEDLSLLNRANNLAFYELLGDASQMNTEFENYNQVTVDDIFEQANEILNPNKCSTMFYLAKKAN